MLVNATHINLYHVCKRELWLHYHGVRMEYNSDLVAEGKLLGELSYPDRSEKYTELQLGNVKIDYYDARNKVVHEIKKSDKVEAAHRAQVMYYLYRLLLVGIEGATGIIEYPALRQKEHVILDPGEIEKIQKWEREIIEICSRDKCPQVLRAKICKSCSYHDFCYIEEE
ncbi:CRISPR-associated protein Cas4 [Myroides sp. WP-1]|uniref:CRISPR-associated protein Cas4 n=1 Tax=Myroides sp. WP-1 TaxID=2759944 RepID=UPI0015F849F3|nr:CRISPR-associated protein Cas4 [Myroides sp. WP-1]MBB1139703.1 CRISPR-associated protein Cas4 [Myroides sp. WP-1]